MLTAAASMVARPAIASTETDFWPTLTLMDQSGAEFRLSQLKTPLVFVNVWAHWCAACWYEMTALHAMVNKLAPGKLTMLLLSHPTNWIADQEAAARRQLGFRLTTLAPAPPWVRSAAFAEHGSTYSVPRSLLFHQASKTMVMAHDGPAEWDSPQQINLLHKLL